MIHTIDIKDKKVNVQVLTIEDVTASIKETLSADITHVSHSIYGVPVSFLRRAFDDFDSYSYEALPELVEGFATANPTCMQDIPKAIVLLDK